MLPARTCCAPTRRWAHSATRWNRAITRPTIPHILRETRVVAHFQLIWEPVLNNAQPAELPVPNHLVQNAPGAWKEVLTAAERQVPVIVELEDVRDVVSGNRLFQAPVAVKELRRAGAPQRDPVIAK